MTQSTTRRRRRREPVYYEPELEHDPLILKHVHLRPPDSQKNDPIIVGACGQAYPAWSVYFSYLIAKNDTARAAQEEYGGDFTPDQIEASVRFAKHYPDVVTPYIEPHLTGVLRG